MRVLVLYAHPDPESYVAALHRTVVGSLSASGHAVDDCDLYAEGFDPVLPLTERRGYHLVPDNRAPVSDHVARLTAAEALVLVHPVWNFGQPAILKGYFDRVFLPGVAFTMETGRPAPALANIRRLAAVTTYGATRFKALLMGDPPRRHVTRMLRAICCGASVDYLAHYGQNAATRAEREAFIARVRTRMERF
jgi:putative NADPH-quinone reductase